MKMSPGRRNFIGQAAKGMVSGLSVIGLAPNVTALQKRKGRLPGGALSEDFIARLPRMLEWGNVPGLSVALIADGKLTWSQGFGVKKAGSSEPVTDDTVFGAASLSKPVFAYAVFKLRDEKLIDLDRPLVEYLSPSDLPDDPRSKKITARHVLSHTTGWQNWRFQKGNNLTFSSNPGEQFGYSGEGYFYLQRVVEHITGKGFEEFMRDRVLKPFGMVNSSYVWLPEHERLISSGHNSRGVPSEAWNARQGTKLQKVAADWKKPLSSWKYEDVLRALSQVDPGLVQLPNFVIPNCAGSLLTTASEYAKFMIRILDKPLQDEFSITEASRRDMLASQVKLNSAISWGLGWGLENEDGSNCFWHWGDNGNFKAFAFGNPARRSGVVVLTNAAMGHKLWQRIVAEATGRDHASFLWWQT